MNPTGFIAECITMLKDVYEHNPTMDILPLRCTLLLETPKNTRKQIGLFAPLHFFIYDKHEIILATRTTNISVTANREQAELEACDALMDGLQQWIVITLGYTLTRDSHNSILIQPKERKTKKK